MEEKAKKLAIEDGYADVINMGRWNGYWVFQPIQEDRRELNCVGWPFDYYLAKDGKARKATPQEFQKLYGRNGVGLTSTSPFPELQKIFTKEQEIEIFGYPITKDPV